jgi:hypothetical protein
MVIVHPSPLVGEEMGVRGRFSMNFPLTPPLSRRGEGAMNGYGK